MRRFSRGPFGGPFVFLLEFGLEATKQRKRKNCASTDNGVGKYDSSDEFKVFLCESCLGSF